jgi:hypothetical protein
MPKALNFSALKEKKRVTQIMNLQYLSCLRTICSFGGEGYWGLNPGPNTDLFNFLPRIYKRPQLCF